MYDTDAMMELPGALPGIPYELSLHSFCEQIANPLLPAPKDSGSQ